MADDSSSGGGAPGGSPVPAPASLEDHNAKVGIVQWPRRKKRPRTGNRLLDLASH